MYLITCGTIEVLEPIDEYHASASDCEADSDDNEFEPDADELVAVTDYERTNARGEEGEQDSGKILLYQTHLAYLRKQPHTPARKMRIQSTRREMVTTRKEVCCAIYWSFIHV
jgi:hypothetical protein